MKVQTAGLTSTPLDSSQFLENSHQALNDEKLQEKMRVMGVALPAMRKKHFESVDNFDELRGFIKRMKNHTLRHLDHYLKQYEERLIANGGQLHWATSGDEVNDIVLGICQQHNAKTVAKGKSMVTEETGLSAFLEQHQLQVTETDLGEYIVQIAGQRPSHIVGPALHMSVEEIRQLFLEKHDLGERDLSTPELLVREARGILRERFINADVGIIGANAVIAESGSTMLVTNEGNGDLCSLIPKVQIVVTTIDKLVPRPEDAMAILRVLVRSVTGQAASSYTSFYSGPRQNGEADGPDEFHVILLDNHRSDLIGGKYQDMLRCVRCAACLAHCPIYAAVGGHAYGSVYPGPMGSILTPLLNGIEDSVDLASACTTCGRCTEVCNGDIPIPDLLRQLRSDANEQGSSSARWRIGMKIHSWTIQHPKLYQLTTGFAINILARLGAKKGFFSSLLLANGWTKVRDFPAPQGRTFMSQWRKSNRN